MDFYSSANRGTTKFDTTEYLDHIKNNGLLKLVAAVGFLSLGALTYTDVVHAATCYVYYTGSTSGTLGGLAETVAEGPFTINCTGGVFTGTLSYGGGGYMRLRLEKQNAGGTWSVVAGPATSIGYTGNAGTYRYVVANLLNVTTSWSLNFKEPVI